MASNAGSSSNSHSASNHDAGEIIGTDEITGTSRQAVTRSRIRNSLSPMKATTQSQTSSKPSSRSKSPKRRTGTKTTQSQTSSKPSSRSKSPKRRTMTKSSSIKVSSAAAQPVVSVSIATPQGLANRQMETRSARATTLGGRVPQPAPLIPSSSKTIVVETPAGRGKKRKRTKASQTPTPTPPPRRTRSRIDPPTEPEPNDEEGQQTESRSSKKKKTRSAKPQISHICPAEKLRNTIWSVPFLVVLDHICESDIDLSKWYDSFFPTPESMEFPNRTDKYGAINSALGRCINEMSDHLGIPIQLGTTVRQNTRVYAQAKKDFERRFKNSMALFRKVRKQIGSMPSIYWYYSTDAIIRLHCQYQGGPLTPAAETMFNELLGQYVTNNYPAKTLEINRFMYSAPNYAMIDSVNNVVEHACRTYWDVPYDIGMKETRSNDGPRTQQDTPRTFYLRKASKQTHEVYRQSTVAVTGYRLQAGEEGRGLRDHPLSDLAALILGYFDGHIRNRFMRDARQIAACLSMELDTSMAIAEVTDAPAADNDEDLDTRIYGHRVGDNYCIKPWGNMAHHTQFFSQFNAVRSIIAGGEETPANEDIVEMYKMFKFLILVHEFDDLYCDEVEIGASIFKTRMTEYLTPDE